MIFISVIIFYDDFSSGVFDPAWFQDGGSIRVSNSAPIGVFDNSNHGVCGDCDEEDNGDDDDDDDDEVRLG